MAKTFENQGGVASTDPSPLYRWLSSRIVGRVMRPAHLERGRNRTERGRKRSGNRHTVEYFHRFRQPSCAVLLFENQ